jgi:hypothetical protein
LIDKGLKLLSNPSTINGNLKRVERKYLKETNKMKWELDTDITSMHHLKE